MDAKPSPARSKGDLREAGKKRLEEFRQKRQQKGANKPSDEQRSKLGHESQSEAASSLPDGGQTAEVRQQEETTEKESKLEEDGKGLEVLVEEFQRKLEAAVAENDVLAQENQTVSRRFNEQMERLAKLKEDEGRFERLEAMVEELQSKLEEKDVMVEKNQVSSQKLIDRMEGFQQENEKLREEGSRLEQDREKLEALVEGLRTKLEAAVAEKVELLKENETVSQQFNEAMERSHQEHEKLREKERKLEADSKRLEDLVGDLQTKLDAAVAEKHELTKENQTASEQFDEQGARYQQEHEQMLEEQRQKQSRLEEDRKKLEAVVGELQTKLDAIVAEKDELVRASQEASHQFNEQKARYQQEMLAEKESRLEEDRKRSEALVGELQRKLDAAVAEKGELVIESQTASHRFNEQLERYQHEHEEVMKKADKLEDDRKKLEALVGELQTKLDAIVAEKVELVEEGARYQEQLLEELREKESRLEEDRNKLEALVGELQTKLDAAVTKKDELVIENQTASHRLNEQLERYQHEHEEVAKLKEKEGRLEDDRKKLEALVGELQTKLDATVAEKDELVEENQRALHEVNKLRASHKREQEEMLAELRENESRLERGRKLEPLVGELQRKLDAAVAEKDELVMENQSASQRFNEQMERYQQEHDELAKLKEKENRLEDDRKKLEVLVSELQARLEAAVVEKDELDKRNQTTSERFNVETQRRQQEHGNVVAKLKEEEAKLQALVCELQAAVIMKDVEVNNRTERCKQEHEELLAQLTEKESSLEDERKKLESSVEELQGKLEAVLAEKDELINEKQTASQQFSEQHRHYQEDMLMKVSEQETRLEENRKKLETMVEELKRLEEDRNKVAEELQRSQEDKKQLEAMIEELQRKLEKDVTRINEQIGLRHEPERIEADNQQQLAEIQRYQSAIKEYEVCNGQLRASCEELRHQLETDSHEKCEMATRFEKLQSQFEEEKQRILEEKRLEQRHTNEEVRKALLSDVEKFALYLLNEADSSSPHEPITSYCEVLRSSFESIMDLFRANKKERQDLLKTIEDQSKLLEELEKAASSRVEEQVARLQSEWETVEAGFRQEVRTLQDENMLLMEQIALLKHQMQETADSTELVERQLEDVNTRLHDEHARVESLEAENQKLEEQLRQLRNESQDELTSIKRQLQGTKEAAEGAESRLHVVNRKLMEEQDRLESLEAEKQQLSDQVVHLRSESQDRELHRQHEERLWGYYEENIRRLESLFHSQHQMTAEKLEQVAVKAESVIEEARLRISGLQSKLDLLEADALEQELQNNRVRLLIKQAVSMLAPGEYFGADYATEACIAAELSIVARRVQAKDDELHLLQTEKEAAVSVVAEKEKSIEGLLVREQDMIDELSRVRAHEEQLQLKLEQETRKLLSTKEKLNLAVTKGKGLVQERDVLRKTIAELEARSGALDEQLSKLKLFSGEADVDLLRKVESFVEEFCSLRRNAAVTKDRIGQLMEELSTKAQAIMAVGDEKDELLRKLDTVTAEQSQQKLQLEQKLEDWSEQLLRIFHTVVRVLSTETGDDISRSEPEDEIVKQLERVISVLVSKFSTTILRNKGLSDELTALGAQVKRLEEVQLRLQEEHALKDAELRSVNHKWEKANADLARYTADLVQQLESSKAMVSSLDEDQKTSRKKLEEALREQDRMQRELLESEQRLGVVREKLGLAIKKGKTVSQQRDELKQMLADKSAATEALQSSYQALEDALSAAKMLQAENERALRDEVRTLTSMLDECRMLLQGASENETSLREQLNGVTGSLKATSEGKRLLQEELKEVSSHLKEAHRRLKTMEEAEQQLQSALDSANDQKRLYEVLDEKLNQVLELDAQSHEKEVAALDEVELMALELLRLAGGGDVIPNRPQTTTKRSRTSFALSATGLHQLKEWHERKFRVSVDKISFTKQLLHKAIEMIAPLEQMKAEMAEESVKAVQSLQVQVSSKDAELESLTTKLRDANEEIAYLSQQLDELQTVIEDNCTAMDSMESARSKAVGKLTYTVGHLTELQRQCEAMLVEIENLHANLSSCKEETVSLNEKIKLLEADLQDRNSFIMRLQKALALLLAKTNKQETTAADTEEMLEPVALIDSLGTQTQRLLHENETLRATVQSKDVELQDLSRRLVEAASFNAHDTRLRAGNVAEPSVVEIEELEQAPRHTTAAHFRSQKKALVSDHVVVDMDSRSVAELEDKGHGFKSMGLIRFFPRACHQFGDRVDALCLFAGRYLTRQPVARLFFIVYSICIHFWLISTLTMGKR